MRVLCARMCNLSVFLGVTEKEFSLTTFAELGLMPELLRAVNEAQYDVPTPIQERTIPLVLQGNDVLACAQTGTGKTASFLLPTLQRLARGERGRVRALVLAPTRELAVQIGESALIYGKYLRLRTTVVYGGADLRGQAERLRRGVDLLVATPGRLLDHMERGNVSLASLISLTLDEADRMCDMGFMPDVRRILRAATAERQTLLFSATMPVEIERLAHDILKTPAVIDVGRRATPVASVQQVIYAVEESRKSELLNHLLQHGNMPHVLVFTRTKTRADRLAGRLAQNGCQVESFHGGKSQSVRTQTLHRFRNGKVKVLVATDIAARGLDVEGISHVVNFDIPNVPEDYVHRIGRTARAEATGAAISLVSSEEVDFVRGIERLIGGVIPRHVVGGFEPGPGMLRRLTQAPPSSMAERIANGNVRHFGPQRRSSRRSA